MIETILVEGHAETILVEGYAKLFSHKSVVYDKINLSHLPICVLYDFLLTVKAAPHECVIRTGQP